MSTRRDPLSLPALDPADLADLIEVLRLLEDFLIHGDGEVVDELASYRWPAPQDPLDWARWVAGLLGEHAAALSALLTARTPTPGRIGESR